MLFFYFDSILAMYQVRSILHMIHDAIAKNARQPVRTFFSASFDIDYWNWTNPVRSLCIYHYCHLTEYEPFYFSHSLPAKSRDPVFPSSLWKDHNQTNLLLNRQRLCSRPPHRAAAVVQAYSPPQGQVPCLAVWPAVHSNRIDPFH